MSSFPEALISYHKETPYTNEYVAEIAKNREALGGQLFFDRLLARLDLSGSVVVGLYPPKDLESTLLLVQKIENSETSNRLNQACLIYYILLDFPLGDDSISQYYSSELDIPAGHKALIQGFWYIDHLDFEKGLIKLGHPEALATFSDELIAVIFSGLAASSQIVAARQVLAYVTAKIPLLQTEETLECLVQALCVSSDSLFPALKFVRSVAPSTRSIILQEVVNYALNTKQALRLANLPLTEEEQKSMEDILSGIIANGGALASSAKDVLLMRCLHGVKDRKKALTVTRLEAPDDSLRSSNSGVTWADLGKGLQKGNIQT